MLTLMRKNRNYSVIIDRKKLLYAFMMILIISIFLPVISIADTISGQCGDNTTWVLSDNGVLRISGTGEIWDAKEVYHPEYDGYENVLPWNDYKNDIKSVVIGEGITRIGANVFCSCENLKAAVIPNSIKSIGNFSFFYTGLEEIILPEGLTSIGQQAFCGTKLKKLVIPGSITSIKSGICEGCEQLETVIFKENDSESIFYYSSGLFRRCISLKDITVESGNSYFESVNGVLYCDNVLISYPAGKTDSVFTVWDGCKRIMQLAFCEGSQDLKEIIIPPSVCSIDAYSVACRNIERIIIKNPECEIADEFTLLHPVIYGLKNSTAHDFAEKNGCEFVAIACSHTFGEWTVVKTPTINSEGTRERVCTICGEKQTESINKLTAETLPESSTRSGDTPAASAGSSSSTGKTNSTTDSLKKARKKVNPIIIKTKTVKVSYSKLKKRIVSVAARKAFTVKKAVGKVTYKKISGSKKISISKTGKITVNKKTKKGKYKVKIRVTAAGNKYYKAKAKTVSITIIVR